MPITPADAAFFDALKREFPEFRSYTNEYLAQKISDQYIKMYPDQPVPPLRSAWQSLRLMPTPEELAELPGVSIVDDPLQIPSFGGPPDDAASKKLFVSSAASKKERVKHLKERVKQFSDYGRRGNAEDIKYAKEQFDKAKEELARLKSKTISMSTKPKTVGHTVVTKDRKPKKTTFVKVFEVFHGRKPTKAEFKELVAVWKSLNNQDFFETREIVDAFLQDTDPAIRKAAEQLDMALYVEEYDIAEKQRIEKQKKAPSPITARKAEIDKKIDKIGQEMARLEAAKAQMSGRGEGKAVKIADTNIKKLKDRLARLIKQLRNERGAVEIPRWMIGEIGEAWDPTNIIEWIKDKGRLLGEPGAADFIDNIERGRGIPLTEEKVMQVKRMMDAAIPEKLTGIPATERPLVTEHHGAPLTPSEAAEYKRILTAQEEAAAKWEAKGQPTIEENIARRRAERAERLRVRAARELGHARRSTRALSKIGNVAEYKRPPMDSSDFLEDLVEQLEQLKLDREARTKLALEAAANIDSAKVRLTDKMPKWWINEQARKAKAQALRDSWRVLPGGKGTKRLPPGRPEKGVGAPIPKGATIETYPRLVGGKRYTTKPTGIHRPKPGDWEGLRGTLKGLGRVGGAGIPALMIPDLVQSVVSGAREEGWKGAGKAIGEYGPLIVPGMPTGGDIITPADREQMLEDIEQGRREGKFEESVERDKLIQEASKRMAIKSGYKPSGRYGPSVKAEPIEQSILLSDEEAMAEALELLGISDAKPEPKKEPYDWEEVMN